MSKKGRALLVAIGMRPRAGAASGSDPDDDGDDDAGPPSSESYAPDEATVKAAGDAMDALHARDADGYARAMCALIDAHEESKKG